MELYPMKFIPIFKDKIWGGERLKKFYKQDITGCAIGESWVVSALDSDDSVVENGYLAENTLSELLEVYMGDLVGEHIYDKYGDAFPLLVKFIDAKDKLSIQVHPNDELAEEEHGEWGKAEMWYVMEATPEAQVVLGFNRPVSEEDFIIAVENNTFDGLLQRYSVKKGDVLYIPSGCIHAMCEGVLICEVQQASDITYRVYDYNRKDNNNNARELHIDLARRAIDYDNWKHGKVRYDIKPNSIANLVDIDYFTVNVMNVDKQKEYDISEIDSFVILTCVDGHVTCSWGDDFLTLTEGESLFIPAIIQNVRLIPTVSSKLLETYIK